MALFRHIPIKYKFLSVLLFIMLSALSIFFFYVFQTFSEDKTVFIMDFNLNVLKAATQDIRQVIGIRMEYIQSLIPKIYALSQQGSKSFKNTGTTLPEEVLRFTFYKRSEDGNFVRFLKFENEPLQKKNSISGEILDRVNKDHPLPLGRFFTNPRLTLMNRSLSLEGGKPLPILTIVVIGASLNENQKMIIAVDFLQDFLIKKLGESELAELFLLNEFGYLISYADPYVVVSNASAPYAHPIVESIRRMRASKESMEMEVQGEPYLVNVGEAGIGGLFVVSQIKKNEAFLALKLLLIKALILAGLIISASVVVSIAFANRLTRNIEKLGFAAEKIGGGELDVKLDIRSNDEVQKVSRIFVWMAGRIKQLLLDTAQKVRMEQELKTAQLMQSTILNPPDTGSEFVEVASHYTSATECGGDIWDFRFQNNKATFFLGDATGHGASAALVTALVKSCFSTLGTEQVGKNLTPEGLLDVLNTVVYNTCRGQLLMTMVIVELDLITGEIVVANAGHECPFFISGRGEGATGSRKRSVDILFARGERLGFQPGYPYQTRRYQLNVGDSILLYSDGLTEAEDASGNELGERALRRVLNSSRQLPSTGIKGEIEKCLKSHIGDTPQTDDVTFVLFRWNKKVSEPASVLNPPQSNRTRPIWAA